MDWVAKVGRGSAVKPGGISTFDLEAGDVPFHSESIGHYVRVDIESVWDH
jgi:hypothetical protein